MARVLRTPSAEQSLLEIARYIARQSQSVQNAMQLRARLTSVEPAPRGLGLSQSEWTALNLEEADE
jgi:hypothetical protein